MSIEVKITNVVGKGSNNQVICVDAWKKILTKKYLTEIAHQIYKKPMIEKTNKGFLISGEVKERLLPNFVLDIDLKKSKEKASVQARYSVYIGENDAGSASMSDAYTAFRYSDEIEELLKKYF